MKGFTALACLLLLAWQPADALGRGDLEDELSSFELGTLGCALPDAIGAKIAVPETPVVVLVGDGGFLFTIQELATAVEEELELAIPIVLWNNDSLAMIRDGMVERAIPETGVNPKNPDFIKIAEGFGCHALRPDNMDAFTDAVDVALSATEPTVIEVREDADWLS